MSLTKCGVTAEAGRAAGRPLFGKTTATLDGLGSQGGACQGARLGSDALLSLQRRLLRTPCMTYLFLVVLQGAEAGDR